MALIRVRPANKPKQPPNKKNKNNNNNKRNNIHALTNSLIFNKKNNQIKCHFVEFLAAAAIACKTNDDCYAQYNTIQVYQKDIDDFYYLTGMSLNH